jgi:hypothetical protein
MKKNILVESIRGLILKAEPVTDNVKTVNYKRVETAIAHAFDELIKTLYDRDKDVIEAMYVKHYYDQDMISNNNREYILIADDFVHMPNGRGVWYVKGTNGGEDPGGFETYANSTVSGTALFASLNIGDAINDTVYRIGNVPSETLKAIIFQHIGNSQRKNVISVDFGLVRTFSSYDDTEDVHMPNDSFAYVVDQVMKWFGNDRYNDKINNDQ